MRKLFLGRWVWLWGMVFGATFAWGGDCFASASDSIKVERLLGEASRLPADSCRTLFFARQLMGIPYVANTLDAKDEETLVIHLDKADCTTFVETVVALVLAEREEKKDFGSFKRALERIRYRSGEREGYLSRLHYFSDWIKDNEQKGIVRERTKELGLSLPQVLNLNFMSTHPASYRQLKSHPELVAELVEIERGWENVPVTYIPKSKLNARRAELGIRNGDILAITTNISGLDVVHTGFACWVGEKLHLLHASSVLKKVVLDSQALYDYSKNKKAHTGVRVVSVVR